MQAMSGEVLQASSVAQEPCVLLPHGIRYCMDSSLTDRAGRRGEGSLGEGGQEACGVAFVTLDAQTDGSAQGKRLMRTSRRLAVPRRRKTHGRTTDQHASGRRGIQK